MTFKSIFYYLIKINNCQRVFKLMINIYSNKNILK